MGAMNLRFCLQLASPHGRPRLGSLVPEETLLEFSIAGIVTAQVFRFENIMCYYVPWRSLFCNLASTSVQISNTVASF